MKILGLAGVKFEGDCEREHERVRMAGGASLGGWRGRELEDAADEEEEVRVRRGVCTGICTCVCSTGEGGRTMTSEKFGNKVRWTGE